MTYDSTLTRRAWAGSLAPLSAVLLLPWIVSGLGAGCSDDPASSSPSATSTTGTGGAGGDGGGGGAATTSTGGGATCETEETDGRAFFEANVQGALLDECGTCHVSLGAADFLAPPSAYESITTYQSAVSGDALVQDDPASSILFAYPDSAIHNGKKYPADGELKQNVLCWLTIESKAVPPDKSIVPIKPILGQLNSVILTPLGFPNSAVYFIPVELSSTQLQLKKVEVYPAAGTALNILHPVFQVCPPPAPGAPPTCEDDTGDGFAEVDDIFCPQGDPRLGDGEIIIDNWKKNAKLTLSFGFINAASTEGCDATPCADVAAYQGAVETLGQNGPLYCAEQCHGGAEAIQQSNAAQANGAMDLSGLLEEPRDYEAACSWMRVRITPGVPEESQILDVTMPGSPIVHLFKFNNDSDAYDDFRAAMSTWIEAEAGEGGGGGGQ